MRPLSPCPQLCHRSRSHFVSPNSGLMRSVSCLYDVYMRCLWRRLRVQPSPRDTFLTANCRYENEQLQQQGLKFTNIVTQVRVPAFPPSYPPLVLHPCCLLPLQYSSHFISVSPPLPSQLPTLTPQPASWWHEWPRQTHRSALPPLPLPSPPRRLCPSRCPQFLRRALLSCSARLQLSGSEFISCDARWRAAALHGLTRRRLSRRSCSSS